jgi:hypothetical protein
MKYHKKFRNIDLRTRRLTKNLLRGWKDCDAEQRMDKMHTWLDGASSIYRMEPPRLNLDRGSGHGCYYPGRNTIHVPYPSVVTLLHEFRHAMQHQKGAGRGVDIEDDARAWSLSLYYLVAPRTLTRLGSEGAIFFVNDLTG